MLLEDRLVLEYPCVFQGTFLLYEIYNAEQPCLRTNNILAFPICVSLCSQHLRHLVWSTYCSHKDSHYYESYSIHIRIIRLSILIVFSGLTCQGQRRGVNR
jgi:hypothetical protein